MSYGLSILAIVKQVCVRTGLPQPLSIITSDPQTLQMVGLLNEELEENPLRAQWTSFIRQVTFNSLGVSDQGDIDTIAGFKVNYILNDTLWDATQRLPVFGPKSPQTWEQLKALQLNGTLLQYRIEQNRLLFYPLTPPVGHVINFEASQAWGVVDTVTTPGTTLSKQFFTLDTDQCCLPDALLLAALRWRFKREKGLSYAEDFSRYEAILSDLMSRDGTGAILDLGGVPCDFRPGIVIPPGSWNITGGGYP